jgi:diguanylate cyclase (GGDEF)-like protein
MKSIFIAGAIGLLSILLLIIFYSHQNNFSNNYKQILATLHTLDSLDQKLTYNILQNSIYLYSNQDNIAQNRASLTQTLQSLKEYELIQNKQYKEIDKKIQALEVQTKNYFYKLDSFLTLNAGIKNSFIYINTHAYNAIIKEKHDPKYIRISQYISKAFITAGRTLDIDLLKKTKKKVQILYNYNQSLSKPSRSIGLFLLHVRFITDNFPPYIDALNYLLSSPLLENITDIQNNFTDIAAEDIKDLNYFAIFLMTLFILSFIYISGLLLRIRSENKKLEKAQKELHTSLVYDHLTGLKNRFSFEKELVELKKPTLILFNLDNFKHINDFYGVERGDFILKTCADIFKDITLNQFNEHIFRLGGDDFGIILEDVSQEVAAQNAQTIIHAIDTYNFVINNIRINITVSAAISNEAPLIENADMALKHIKSLVNEKLIIYSEELGLRKTISHNIEITNTLKEAINNNRIVPHFQPIFHLKNQKIEKYEALVRIQCISGDILQPWEFLPIAVKTPYYGEITRIMIQKSMDYFQDLPYRFSVNIAMQDLLNIELMNIIKETLEKNKETAKRLDFELLESEHIENIELVNSFIREIKSFGCRVSIDDFGSGFSNFAYLSHLNIDILKIDGSLIKEINNDPKSYQIVKTIIEFATINKLEVVAEFVEDAAIAECLQTLGVTYAQGYYYGKPLPDTL